MMTLDMLMVINQLGKKIAISNQALKCKKADYSIQFLLTISLLNQTPGFAIIKEMISNLKKLLIAKQILYVNLMGNVLVYMVQYGE